MFANHPEMAKRWAKETPKGKRLPKHKKKRKMKSSRKAERRMGRKG